MNIPASTLVIILCVERIGLGWDKCVGLIWEWDMMGCKDDVFCVVSVRGIKGIGWVGEEVMVEWDKVASGEGWDDVLWEGGKDMVSKWWEYGSLSAVSTSKMFKLLLETGIVYCWWRLYWNSKNLDGEWKWGFKKNK